MADNFECLALDERKRLGVTGGVEVYYIAKCRTLTGTFYTVELTEAQLDPATAREIMSAKATKLEAVKKS